VATAYAIDGCYTDVLWSSADEIVRGGANASAPLWQSHPRTVYGGQLIAGSRVLLHTGAHVERYSLTDGSLVDSVALEAAEQPASLCVTARSVFTSTPRTPRLTHHDLTSGRRRAAVTTPEYAFGDAPLLACSSSSSSSNEVYAAFDRVVWVLSADDALPLRVLVRLPAAPAAVRLHTDGRLFVALGRPAFAVAVVNTTSGALVMLPVDDEHAAEVDSLAVSLDGRLVMGANRATGVAAPIAFAADRSVNVVATEKERYYALHVDELLSTRYALSNGVVYDMSEFAYPGGASSALTNQGNLGELAALATWADYPDLLSLVDTAGVVATLSLADPSVFEFNVPLSSRCSPSCRLLDFSAPPAILYTDGVSRVYWRLEYHSWEDDATAVSPVVAPLVGVLSNVTGAERWCVANASSSVVVCVALANPLDTRRLVFPAHPLPFSMAWGTADSASVVLLWPEVALSAARFVRVDIESDRVVEDRLLPLSPPVDPSYWRVDQLRDDGSEWPLLVRYSATAALLVSSANGTVLSRALDGALPSDRLVTLVPGAALATDDDAEAVCVTDESVHHRRAHHGGGDGPTAVIVLGFLFAVCCGGMGLSLTVVGLAMGFTAASPNSRWQQLTPQDRRGCLKVLFCNRSAQSCVYSTLSVCAPACVADTVNTWMQRTWTEATVYTGDGDGAALAR
jgi:hypothetical protein